eukprot:994736-Amorphochlora_amoeboformis.AAC.2
MMTIKDNHAHDDHHENHFLRWMTFNMCFEYMCVTVYMLVAGHRGRPRAGGERVAAGFHNSQHHTRQTPCS